MKALLIWKIIFLFIGVWFTAINIAKTIRKDCEISPIIFIIQTIGISGFVTLQWLI